MDLLCIEGVSKTYGDHTALRNITFTIPKNCVFGLLGPNGAGKTTLIRIITQIIMSDTGTVYFNGKPVTPDDVRKIGYLPEERGLYKKMKVAEQLLYLARLKGMNRTDAVREINHWLDRFEIRSWINKKVEDLSKGMQQKIQFIATVVHKPTLLILDEPFSGFDPVNANLIKDELYELQQNGATIIFSTHRMESVEELCDHLTLINNAEVVINGSKKEIKNQYRNSTFIVEYEGQLSFGSNGFKELHSVDMGDGIWKSEVQIAAHESVNDLVNYLTSKSRIVSLNEKIPSINDIFISAVKPNNHE